jgi:hypothetical protein
MQVEGTVYARNTMNGVTVMSSDPRSTQFVQWEAKGDPGGGDVQPIPAELMRTPAFVAAVRKGILTVVDPDAHTSLDDRGVSLDEILNKQREVWDSRQAAANEDIRATIETTTNNDMVTLPCVGPSTRGSQNCGEDVVVRELSKYDAPPLCQRHIGLKSEFVPSAKDVDGKGNEVVEWTRSVMDPRVHLPR